MHPNIFSSQILWAFCQSWNLFIILQSKILLWCIYRHGHRLFCWLLNFESILLLCDVIIFTLFHKIFFLSLHRWQSFKIAILSCHCHYAVMRNLKIITQLHCILRRNLKNFTPFFFIFCYHFPFRKFIINFAHRIESTP